MIGFILGMLRFFVISSITFQLCQNGKGKAIPLRAWSGPEVKVPRS